MSYSDALKQVLHLYDIPSLAELARMLEIDRTTVSHHFAALDRTGDLDADFLKRVAAKLDLSPRSLAAKVRAERDESIGLRELVKSLQLPGIPPASHFQNRLSAIFDSLKGGAEYYFATHELPWEFDQKSFTAVIASALKNEVNIYYIFPDVSSEDRKKSSTFSDDYARLIGRADRLWRTLGESYLQFRLILKEEHGCLPEHLTRLHAIWTSDGFLTNPLQRLAYFNEGGADNASGDGYAIVECVFGADTALAATKIWQPLNSKQTSIVKRAFNNAREDGIRIDER